jgi:hypothetical protein
VISPARKAPSVVIRASGGAHVSDISVGGDPEGVEVPQKSLPALASILAEAFDMLRLWGATFGLSLLGIGAMPTVAEAPHPLGKVLFLGCGAFSVCGLLYCWRLSERMKAHVARVAVAREDEPP